MYQKSFLPSVNGLRALAVISVVFYHFQIICDTGFVGVDIFFVISGYLMTDILVRSNNNAVFDELRLFYTNRVRRILPALLVLVVFTVILFFNYLLHADMLMLLRSSFSSYLFFSNYYYGLQHGYFSANTELNPLLHTWSLSIEWQFYLIYPLLITGAKKNGISLKGGLLFLLAVSFAYSVSITRDDWSVSYFDSFSRVWEFLIGAFFIIFKDFIKRYAFDFLWLNLVFICVFLYSIFYINVQTFPGWQAVIPVSFAGFVLLQKKNSLLVKILSTSHFQYIGNISYSLYLWHWVIYVYLLEYTGSENGLTINLKIIGLLLSLLIGHFSHKLIETPVRKNPNYWTLEKIFFGWILSLAILGFISYIVVISKDLGVRLPQYLNKIEFAKSDKNPLENSCFLDHEAAEKSKFRPTFCRFGSATTESPSILLWGDSFADSFQPVVRDVLTVRQLAGVASTAAGCAPIQSSAYGSEHADKKFSHCAAGLGAETLKYLDNNKSIEYIVLVANWARYDLSIVTRELKENICKFNKEGRAVILVGQFPLPSQDVPMQWARLQRKIGNSIDELTFDFEKTRKIALDVESMVDAIKSECGEVKYLNPAKLMCSQNENVCYAVKNGASYYFDDAHITATGSMLFRDSLLKLITTR